MAENTKARFLSFTTNDCTDAAGWLTAAESLRQTLIVALLTAGADLHLTPSPDDPDWSVRGVHKTTPFTVVLVLSQVKPCSWFIAIEGATPTADAAPTIREWAHPILESALRHHPDTAHFRWHTSHKTLPRP